MDVIGGDINTGSDRTTATKGITNATVVTNTVVVSKVTVILGHLQKFGSVTVHMQRIMGNGVFLVPPHDFEHPSCWYDQVLEIEIIV
jgi:hypothetical protein